MMMKSVFVASIFSFQATGRTNALEIAIKVESELIGGIVGGAPGGLGLSFLKTELTQIQLGNIQVDDPYEVIFRDQFLQRDREQAGLAAGLSLYVAHNEKCSVSFDTEHSLKGPDRLLGFHTVCMAPIFILIHLRPPLSCQQCVGQGRLPKLH